MEVSSWDDLYARIIKPINDMSEEEREKYITLKAREIAETLKIKHKE